MANTYPPCSELDFYSPKEWSAPKLWVTTQKRFSHKAILRGIIFAIIVAYLSYRLSQIGWVEVMQALPSSPLFYVLSFGLLLAPVTAEVLAFRTITNHSAPNHFKLFLRKHVFNKAIMNFTGDAYVIHQLSQGTRMSVRQATILMKDMTLIRAFIANFWILGLVLLAVLMGQSGIIEKLVQASPGIVLSVAILSVSVCGGALILFKKLPRLPVNLAGKVAGIYLARSFIVAGLMIAQWSLAIPDMSLSIWLVFLIIFYVTKKSPIGGELVFASVIISVPGLGAENVAIASMLIAIAALSQLLYLIAFIVTNDSPLLVRTAK